MELNNPLRDISFILIAIILAILTSIFQINILITTANTIADLFFKFLQLMSAPIVFLAITNNFLSISEQKHLKQYSKKILFFTVFTTILAAFVAYLLYQILMPASNIPTHIFSNININNSDNSALSNINPDYLAEILKMFPNNIISAFAENNILGIAIIAVIMGFAMIKLPMEQQRILKETFNGLFHTFINVARFIIKALPIGIWAFTVILVDSIINNTISLDGLGKYFAVILAANFIQGFIVLPAILKFNNISPVKLFKSVYPALTTAFFTKSSSAALPLTMDCMIEKHNVKEEIVRLSLPICTIINMNGCAAFIYTTVIFVASLAGLPFSAFDYLLWIFIATIIAIGNASVPMGCYFLSSAILVGMGVPLSIIGIILPIYVFIDMVETCLNVWSDCCVTNLVANNDELNS